MRSLEQNKMRDKNIDHVLCVSCLCIGRTLRKLSENLNKFYMDALYEIPLSNVSYVEPNVCWECEALIKKCLSFREQVKDSYRILQTYTVENLHECLLSDVSRPPRLKIHTNEAINILPCEEVKVEFNSGEKSAKYQLSDTEDFNNDEIQTVLCDIKNEYCSPDDEKDSLSLKNGLEIKSEQEDAIVQKKKDLNKKKVSSSKKRKLERDKVKGKRRKSKDKSDNKIDIEINYEEIDKQILTQECNKIQCESCTLSFTSIAEYGIHMKTEHSDGETVYKCPICKTVISNIDELAAHYKTHAESSVEPARPKESFKRVPCSDCDKTFSHRAGLMNHRVTVHESPNEFPCKLCKKLFRWKNSLKRHLEKHAATKRTPAAYCSSCDIGFGSVASLQRHLRNSLKHVTPDQLRFTCEHCSRRFADKTKLRDHIEGEHLRTTYHCYICDKPSKNRVGLEQHIRNVHKGRPNNKMCHHCGKGFPTKVQLESHLRTHTGERPYICEYCPTTFSQPSNLYKHHRQVHQGIRMDKKKPLKKTEPRAEEHLPLAVVQYMSLPDNMFTV